LSVTAGLALGQLRDTIFLIAWSGCGVFLLASVAVGERSAAAMASVVAVSSVLLLAVRLPDQR